MQCKFFLHIHCKLLFFLLFGHVITAMLLIFKYLLFNMELLWISNSFHYPHIHFATLHGSTLSQTYSPLLPSRFSAILGTNFLQLHMRVVMFLRETLLPIYLHFHKPIPLAFFSNEPSLRQPIIQTIFAPLSWPHPCLFKVCSFLHWFVHLIFVPYYNSHAIFLTTNLQVLLTNFFLHFFAIILRIILFTQTLINNFT